VAAREVLLGQAEETADHLTTMTEARNDVVQEHKQLQEGHQEEARRQRARVQGVRQE